MKKMTGFSLVEMMSCCALLMLVACIALPDFGPLLQNNRNSQYTNQMLAVLHYARGAAVFERKIVTLCPGTTHCSHSNLWQEQLLVFDDHNRNGTLDDEERLLQVLPLEEGITWHWSRQAPYLQFEPDGTTRALNGTLTLCEKNRPQKQIVISLAGRTRTQSPSAVAPCT